MLASLARTRTFWVVAVVLLGYGIITWDDDETGKPKPKPTPTCKRVNVVLDIGMVGQPDRVAVAVAATLGSAGRYAERKTHVWNGLRYPTRYWRHPFTACTGEEVNAEVANLDPPVTLLSCWFWQEGQGNDPEFPGYGNITGPYRDSGEMARCAAVVR